MMDIRMIIKNEKKLKEGSLTSTVSLIIKKNIEEVWLYLLSKSNISNIQKDIPYFEENDSKRMYKYNEIENNKFKKLLSLEIPSEICFSISVVYRLYKITEGDKTLIKITLKRNIIIPILSNLTNFEENKDKNYISKIQNETDYQNNNQENQDLTNYQSCMIKRKFIDTWDFVTNPKKVSQIIPILGYNYLYYGNPFEVGSFWKFIYGNKNKTYFLRINEILTNKKRNTWTYSLETFGTDKSIIPQEIKIRVTKVGNEFSQLTLINIFKEKVNKILMEEIINNKVKIIKILKKYLEQ